MTATTTERSLAQMYGYAYRRAHESGARPGTTLLTYQFRDGSSHTEDVASYFAGPEDWWQVDVMACERAAGRVLAIGCGAGRHALAVARNGHEVIGVEPSADAVTVARDRGLDTRLGSLLDLPEGLGTFDTVLLAGGGLHLVFLAEHQRRALAVLAGIANPGAQLVGTCALLPDGSDPPGFEASAFDYRLRVTHGAEVTAWSSWGSTALLPPEHLRELVSGTPWTVEEVYQAMPPDVPSYLARLRLDGNR